MTSRILVRLPGRKIQPCFPKCPVRRKELRKDSTDTTDELEQKLEEEGGGMKWREVGSSEPAVPASRFPVSAALPRPPCVRTHRCACP